MNNSNNNQRSEEESLARSQSKSSNAFLTILCFLTALGFALLFFGLGLYGLEASKNIGLILAICGGVVTGLGILGGLLFKR